MHSDCVPYVYGRELQDKLFVCNIRGEEINKSDMRCEMWNIFLDEQKKKCSRSFELLFGNIMFIPRTGHALRVQQIVLNETDLHHSKQLLSSCFEALSKEHSNRRGS